MPYLYGMDEALSGWWKAAVLDSRVISLARVRSCLDGLLTGENLPPPWQGKRLPLISHGSLISPLRHLSPR